MKLLVVESPNKVPDLRKYLQRAEPGQWEVVATVGHFRGLPEMDGKEIADVVDRRNGWRETFLTKAGKRDAEKRLRAAAKRATEVYLATDDDREGEAIAWHVMQVCKLSENSPRVRCHEITEAGVVSAIRNAGRINLGLVDAQRARALLDYMIGMEVSRRLWRFGARSAGRLQSAALRIIVDREWRIQEFEYRDFWRLFVDFREGFSASMCVEEAPTAEELDENPELEVERRWVPKRFFDQAQAEHAKTVVGEGSRFVVDKVDTTPVVKHPPSPFTTADLLSTASRRLKLCSSRTSAAAQALFEKGLITYIRTDSVEMAPEAIEMVREFIRESFPDLLPPSPPKRRKKKGAQGAHEAIRPTKMEVKPAVDLTDDEAAVYALVFERTLCSQMAPAVYEQTVVEIRAEDGSFRLRATGRVLREEGWLALAGRPAIDDELPELQVGQRLNVEAVRLEAGRTKPPPRFSEASLVKYLERRGIGRPSTYAQMVATLVDRDYVQIRKSRFVPVDLGYTADGLVRLGFDELSQEDFTARTERALDAIANGELKRESFLDAFDHRLAELLEKTHILFEQFACAHPELVERKPAKSTTTRKPRWPKGKARRKTARK